MTDSTKTIIEEHGANTLTDMEMDEVAGGFLENIVSSGDPTRRFDSATSKTIIEQMVKEISKSQDRESSVVDIVKKSLIGNQ